MFLDKSEVFTVKRIRTFRYVMFVCLCILLLKLNHARVSRNYMYNKYTYLKLSVLSIMFLHYSFIENSREKCDKLLTRHCFW